MFTLQNTINEILASSGPELTLFTSGLLQFIPDADRDRPLNALAETLTMPWGAPLPVDDLVAEANMVAEGDRIWDLIPLWHDDLTGSAFRIPDAAEKHAVRRPPRGHYLPRRRV